MSERIRPRPRSYSNSSPSAKNDARSSSPAISPSRNGARSSPNQTLQATPILDGVVCHLTVVDARHGLAGQRLELVSAQSSRGPAFVVVRLPDGRRRSIRRSVGDDAFTQIGREGVDHRLPRLPWAVGWNLQTTFDIFADRLAVDATSPAIAETHRPCRCKSKIITSSPRSITACSLPTIGSSIGNSAPPVFRGAPRKTGGSAKLGKIQTALLGSFHPAATTAKRHAPVGGPEVRSRTLRPRRHQQGHHQCHPPLTRQLPLPSRGLKTGHRNCRRPDIKIVVAQGRLQGSGAGRSCMTEGKMQRDRAPVTGV